MKSGDDFLAAAGGAVLTRAAHAAGMPLSIHGYSVQGEASPMWSCGTCLACSFVNDLPQGRAACQTSRATVARKALRQKRALPFVCHMGFSCLSVPLPEEDDRVLTFGPFVPIEASDALAQGAREGLQALAPGGKGDLPFSLHDIRPAPLDSIYALAEWTVESLGVARNTWMKSTGAINTGEAADVRDAAGKTQRRPLPGSKVENAAAHLAALLAAGDLNAAKRLLSSVIEERPVQGKMTLPALRARILALCARVVEAAELAGVDTAPAWERLDVLHRDIMEAPSALELRRAALRFFRKLAPAPASPRAPEAAEKGLNSAIQARFPARVLLKEVAVEVGQSPSAISHRLLRKYGMSFSDYVARLRIEEAKRLLRQTRLTFGEVGVRVGISDQSNFSKLFKKFAGTTPSAYRSRQGRTP